MIAPLFIMTTAQITGVYPLHDAPEICHLIELAVFDGNGTFDLTKITQVVSDLEPASWQCPYLERIVSVDGLEILTDLDEAEELPHLWYGNYRLVFFFHFLDFSKPLRTPFGELNIPRESALPDRLLGISYE